MFGTEIVSINQQIHSKHFFHNITQCRGKQQHVINNSYNYLDIKLIINGSQSSEHIGQVCENWNPVNVHTHWHKVTWFKATGVHAFEWSVLLWHSLVERGSWPNMHTTIWAAFILPPHITGIRHNITSVYYTPWLTKLTIRTRSKEWYKKNVRHILTLNAKPLGRTIPCSPLPLSVWARPLHSALAGYASPSLATEARINRAQAFYINGYFAVRGVYLCGTLFLKQ